VTQRRPAEEPLRGAIELAFAVAVAGTRMRPPLPSPPSLRPYLRFQKLPPAALGPVRKAVETDDEFRQRVAAVATEELVGRAGWLWLHRPDDWSIELDTLLAAEAEESASAADARTERAVGKRADAAEAAARRATGELAAVRAELATAVERRRDLEASQARLERRATQLEIELGGARRRLEQADLDVAAASTRVAEAEQRTGDAEARLGMVEARLTEAEARARVAEAALELARRGAEAPPAAQPAEPAPRRDEGLVAALRDAAAATQRLGEALAAAVDAIAPDPGDPEVAQPMPTARPRRLRRTPLLLPGGVFADTVQAAAHLVRQPGVTLVVDGYNAAKLGWPDETLPLQRERLLDALDELVARHGTAVHVVFDGADVPVAPVRRRRCMHVEFSPPGVPADDVIVDLVSAIPADRPVIVATNDNEVRTGARRGGANVISSQQLLAVARR
jgi:predicted RNA-binding protein with PIN domain